MRHAHGADERGLRAVHVPFGDETSGLLPEDVVLAVVVEIAGALDLPVRTGVERTNSADKRGVGPVHQPHRGLAVGVLPDQIVLAITVEVADALDLPVGTWIERTDGTDKGGVGVGVHQPHRSLAVIMLQDDIGVAVTVEVAAALDVPAGEPARRERADLGVDLAAIATVHQPQVDIAVDLLRDRRSSSVPSPLRRRWP